MEKLKQLTDITTISRIHSHPYLVKFGSGAFEFYIGLISYLAIQRSVWLDIKFAVFFVRLRISQRRMVRSA